MQLSEVDENIEFLYLPYAHGWSVGREPAIPQDHVSNSTNHSSEWNILTGEAAIENVNTIDDRRSNIVRN